MASVWDLVVRLTGNGQGLRDDIDEDIAKIDELRAALTDKDMTVSVEAAEADAILDDLKAKTEALRDLVLNITAEDPEANLALDELKAKADDLNEIAMRINVYDAEIALEDLNVLQAKADELRANLAAIPVNLLDEEAQLQLDELQAKLDAIHDKTVVVNVEEEQNGVGAGASGAGGTVLGPALMTASPILGPVGAAGIGGLMGLLSAATPGISGMAGFGALMVSELTPVVTATEALKTAQTQYNEAVTNAQKLTALKAEQAALAGLDAEQRKAAGTVAEFEKEWDGMRKQFEPSLIKVFINALNGLMELMKSLEPAIKGFASGFITLQEEGSKALKDPFWKSYFKWLGTEARASTLTFGQGLGNLAKGFAALLMAFNPVAQKMDIGWTKMTASFANWASHLSATQGFKNFLHDVEVDGPLVLSVIGQLVLLINNLLRGMEPLGRVMLQIIDHVLKFTNGLLNGNKWLRTFAGDILFAVGAFKFLSLAWKAVSVLLEALPALLEGVSVAFDVVGVAITAMGGPWGLLALAVAAGVVLMITHWKTIQTWWGDFTRWIGHMWDAVLVPFFKRWGPDILLVLAPFIGIPLAIWQHWSQISKWFGQLWVNVLVPFFKRWGPDILVVLAPFIGIPLMLYQHWSQISKWFASIWAQINRALGTDLKEMTTSFSQMWTTLVKLFDGWIKSAEGIGQNLVSSLVGGVEMEINNAKRGLETAWNDVLSIFGGGKTSVSVGASAALQSATTTIQHRYSGAITHNGSVQVSGLTTRAVQQVNQQMYSQAIRKG